MVGFGTELYRTIKLGSQRIMVNFPINLVSSFVESVHRS